MGETWWKGFKKKNKKQPDNNYYSSLDVDGRREKVRRLACSK